MKNLVSVIIPTYGGADYLERCIDSVLNQTYQSIEVIIVDDNGKGSENQLKTAEKIKKYVGESRVKYICHDVNKNGSAARNTGARNAKGKYIALLDDDDEFTANNIEVQIKELESLPDDYALTYCSGTIFLNEEKIKDSFALESGSLLYEVLLHRVTIGSSRLMIKKEAWDLLGGFDESFRRHQDWEFTARVAAKYKVKAVDNIGCITHLEFRNNPKSAEIARQYREHYLEKMKPYIENLPANQQKDVYVENRLDIAIQFLKEKNVKGFWKEYCRTKPGWRGIKFLVSRAFHIIKRGRLTVSK